MGNKKGSKHNLKLIKKPNPDKRRRSEYDKAFPGYDGLKRTVDQYKYLMDVVEQTHDEFNKVRYANDIVFRGILDKLFDCYLRAKHEYEVVKESLDKTKAAALTIINKKDKDVKK